MARIVDTDVDKSDIAEVLEAAQVISLRTHDHKLIQKITILKGYLDLAKMMPSRDYESNIRRLVDELTVAIHAHISALDGEAWGKYLGWIC